MVHAALLLLMLEAVTTEYLGMSAQMIERTYGHHQPEYMRVAARLR
jgi:hypothetical protein